MPSPFDGHDWVDLSHTLEEGIPAWPTHARFSSTLYESQRLGDAATHHGLTLGEHTGTHMDAPLHFVPDGPAHYGTDEIPLERLAGRAATIGATDLAAGDLLGPDRIEAWEREHGPIEPGDRVLVRYGWDERWTTGPPGRRFLEDWPGLSAGPQSTWSGGAQHSSGATRCRWTPPVRRRTRRTTRCSATRST